MKIGAVTIGQSPRVDVTPDILPIFGEQVELIGEIATSAFAGLITFWLCEAAQLDPLVTAALVGISGHMGSRALYQFERWAQTRLGNSANKERP